MRIDEAQYIKNPKTAASKSIRLIRAKTRFALTGTPIENRLVTIQNPLRQNNFSVVCKSGC
ncbi:MAG: hypothetical protein IJT96_03495 [Lachnospiraceae bacterium]|nr:hypothetical protein [Lachnospiraceae bacterium]